MNALKMKVIKDLLKELSNHDAEALRPQPEEVEMEMGATPEMEDEMDEVAGLDPKKTKDFEDGFKNAFGAPKPAPPSSEKGPMEKLVIEKTAMVDGAAPGEDEMTDEELEELLSKLA